MTEARKCHGCCCGDVLLLLSRDYSAYSPELKLDVILDGQLVGHDPRQQSRGGEERERRGGGDNSGSNGGRGRNRAEGGGKTARASVILQVRDRQPPTNGQQNSSEQADFG